MDSSDKTPDRPPPARPPAARPYSPAGPPTSASSDTGRSEGEPAATKPTPVRQSTGEVPGTREESPPPSREFDIDGVKWIAETAGSALAGAAGDASAIVILVVFSRADGDRPEKETLITRPSLGGLSELELLEAFEAAVDFRRPENRSEVFKDTRRVGGSN